MARTKRHTASIPQLQWFGPGCSQDIRYIGIGLKRPECILATSAGRLFMSNRRGGIMVIEPNGRQCLAGTSHLVSTTRQHLVGLLQRPAGHRLHLSAH